MIHLVVCDYLLKLYKKQSIISGVCVVHLKDFSKIKIKWNENDQLDDDIRNNHYHIVRKKVVVNLQRLCLVMLE